MRKAQHIILYIVIAALAVGCGGHENGRALQPSDTLYTAEVAMEVFNQDPSRALVIIDSALLVGNVDDNLATMLKAKIHSQSNKAQQLDTAQQMLEGLMESDFVKDPDKREVVLDLLVSTTRLRDDYEQCLRWATEKADLCREQGKKTEALRTEAEIGVILVELGEEQEGIERLNDVIASLEGLRQTDETDACIIAIRRKIHVLKKLNRASEVIPLAKHLIEIIGDYREHYEQYTDNSYRMPTDKEEVEGYCDYYTAQANGYLTYAYAALGDTKQARHYLKIYEKSDYGSSLYGRENIAPTWCLLGDYDKMLATYDEVTAQMGDDTVNLDYAKMFRDRAIAAKARGNTAAATNYWQRYSDMKDLLHKQLQRGKAHEYAARYRLQEERLNTEREEAAKKRMGIIASLLGFLLFVVAIFASLLVRQLHSIREKNAVLSKEISEKIEYEEKYLQLVDSGQCVVDSTREQMLPTANYPLPTQELESLSDSELFDQLRRIILEEKLFLDPQFGRQQLIDRLHLSKESIGSAFSKGSQYASLASFVNEMRLIHGAKLLSEHPEMSISDVATASGFASNITFSHNFKERYALTPTEFRNKN
ncbi:MAG: helix-turn-helix domain-containing protein [bacterium]